MSECLFCQIASGEIPAQVVHQDDRCMAIRDINPQAPVHILIIPCEHILSMDNLNDHHAALMGHMLCKARDIARAEAIDRSGYRLVINHGVEAGQSVFHLHLHLMGGRSFAWPPG